MFDLPVQFYQKMQQDEFIPFSNSRPVDPQMCYQHNSKYVQAAIQWNFKLKEFICAKCPQKNFELHFDLLEVQQYFTNLSEKMKTTIKKAQENQQLIEEISKQLLSQSEKINEDLQKHSNLKQQEINTLIYILSDKIPDFSNSKYIEHLLEELCCLSLKYKNYYYEKLNSLNQAYEKLENTCNLVGQISLNEDYSEEDLRIRYEENQKLKKSYQFNYYCVEDEITSICFINWFSKIFQLHRY